MNLLEKIIQEKPSFHEAETETERLIRREDSFLSADEVDRLAHGDLTCYGVGPSVLRFIADSVGVGSKSLETGAGCSTLVFGLRSSSHVAITPSSSEIGRIKAWAASSGIDLSTVEFVARSSDDYLPQCKAHDLDLVLLDGKHAFPWPVVDWFYAAEKLRRGGLMLIDDAQMRSVRLLTEFMIADSGWELEKDFSRKTLAFRKTKENVFDVAWHMQEWMRVSPATPPAQPVPRTIWDRIRDRFQRV